MQSEETNDRNFHSLKVASAVNRFMGSALAEASSSALSIAGVAMNAELHGIPATAVPGALNTATSVSKGVGHGLTAAQFGVKHYERGGSLTESIAVGALSAYAVNALKNTNYFNIPDPALGRSPLFNMTQRFAIQNIRSNLFVNAIMARNNSIDNYEDAQNRGHSQAASVAGASTGLAAEIGMGVMSAGLLGAVITAGASLLFAAGLAGVALMASTGKSMSHNIAYVSHYFVEKSPKVAAMVSDFFNELSSQISEPISPSQVPLSTMDAYFEVSLENHLNKVSRQNLTPDEKAFYLRILEEQIT